MTLRILIVDDSETTRRILRAIVHSREWTVCGEAVTGRDGIEKFGELKPDLVLIDLAMPDMNGLDAASGMAAIDSKTPLILFTVLDLPALAEPARKAGIAEVVSKAQPWDLVSTIERVIAERLPHVQLQPSSVSLPRRRTTRQALLSVGIDNHLADETERAIDVAARFGADRSVARGLLCCFARHTHALSFHRGVSLAETRSAIE